MRRSGVFFGMVVVLLAAGWAPASNMAFAFRVNLGVAGQELRFIALPYDVTPDTAEALCEDLGGDEAVAEVLRWDEATSRFVVHTCGSVTQDFSLEEGMAYGVRSAAGNAIDALLVGMHDQSFTLELAPTTGSNMSWISPPYHLAPVASWAPGARHSGSGTPLQPTVRWARERRCPARKGFPTATRWNSRCRQSGPPATGTFVSRRCCRTGCGRSGRLTWG